MARQKNTERKAIQIFRKDFVQFFANNFGDKCQFFFYNIPDTSGAGVRFQIKRPFDSFLVVDGEPIAIEWKMHKGNGAFPYNKVKDHQLENLSLFSKAQGKSFICIFHLDGDKWDMFISSYLDYNHNINRAKAEDKKSIPLSWFEYKITRDKIGRKKVWDIYKFLTITAWGYYG